MRVRTHGFWSTALWATVAAGLSAQAPAPARPAPAQSQPTFRVQIEAVSQDVVVKDEKGVFVPDLRQEDFEILEDGVRQKITSMTMVAGGRVTNLLAAPPAAPPEGIILPPVHRVNDTSGRIFLFFVDDLQITFSDTLRVRNIFKKMAKELVHDGDLFGIVSSGPSSIQQDMTYDRKRLDAAIEKMTGDGLTPNDIIQGASGSSGPSEVRHRAHVAFKTMEDALTNLEKVHERRKALVWVSSGYDFAPFQAARLGLMDPSSPFLQNTSAQMVNQMTAMQQCATGDATCQNTQFDPTKPGSNPEAANQQQSEEFADADLQLELAEITRAANRANTTIYTVDPRGLVGPSSDIGEPVDPRQWEEYIRKTQDTMRELAEETGGIAVVNMNDYDKAFKRIDNDTSDYYILGYYSSNPDPTRRRRNVVVNVVRKGASVTMSRKEYVLKALPPLPAPRPATPAAVTPAPTPPPR
jgi:VWFA-related protein